MNSGRRGGRESRKSRVMSQAACGASPTKRREDRSGRMEPPVQAPRRSSPSAPKAAQVSDANRTTSSHPCQGYGGLAAERVEGLASEEAQHDLGLAAAEPTSLSQRQPSSAPPALRAHFAAEGLSCRGFFMVSCIVPSSLRRVSQETVQRTSGTLRRGTSMAPCIVPSSPRWVSQETVQHSTRH